MIKTLCNYPLVQAASFSTKAFRASGSGKYTKRLRIESASTRSIPNIWNRAHYFPSKISRRKMSGTAITKEISPLAKQFYLSDLFPHHLETKVGKDVRIGLEEYQMLLTASYEALCAFERGDLEKFDALVGENACQIRAVWIPIISSKNMVDTQLLKNKILDCRKKVYEYLEPKAISKLMRTQNLKEVIHSNLLVELNLEAFFVIQSFLLTETKVVISNGPLLSSLLVQEKTDRKNLKRFGNISSMFAEHLIRELKKFSAAASVQYVRSIAKKIKDQNLERMLSEEFTAKHNHLRLDCTPMFWTYKAVLAIANLEKIPLVVCANFLKNEGQNFRVWKKKCLLFEPNPETPGEFHLARKEDLKSDDNRAAWVVEGVVCQDTENAVSEWKKAMLKYPISSVILAGAADHRQYPAEEDGVKLSALHFQDYEGYKSFAQLAGFSFENPTTFFIRHVYPSRIKRLSTNPTFGL